MSAQLPFQVHISLNVYGTSLNTSSRHSKKPATNCFKEAPKATP